MELNNELLKEEPEETPKSPKRNTKHHLIKRILELGEKTGIEIEESDSKLKRMNKEQLQKKLAEVMEKELRAKMAEQFTGQKTSEASNTVLSIGALRMVHNIVVKGCGTLYNKVGAPFVGYELCNFSQNMSSPQFQETIDEILVEISNENPEVLQYFESPYARLAMVWLSVAMMSLKKRVVKKKDVQQMEPRNTHSAFRNGPNRRQENGKVNRNVTPDFKKTFSV